MDSYFVVYNSEDGTVVHELSEAELLRRLSDDYYGTHEFKKTVINDAHTQYWNDQLLIIKGKIVVPKEKAVQPVFEVE